MYSIAANGQSIRESAVLEVSTLFTMARYWRDLSRKYLAGTRLPVISSMSVQAQPFTACLANSLTIAMMRDCSARSSTEAKDRVFVGFWADTRDAMLTDL